MAFNFNWSPLIADTSRAREMLTTALNKSPKPPIIVDDIIVTELNLGSTPPELEILEIGDLAEDRFRGIFKMTYRGDAYLTLKTRVQANPFNTYLSAKPTFASPQPLAAHSGLTIPLQITLSDIRLSGFVILVFSRQKGLTLVFRNDPLESLKVSSTFDSIAFVRDYLQREIEGQLRVLFMEDLPAILHRLSLRLWSPEYRELDDELAKKAAEDTKPPVDPLASPPQDPVDFFGNPLDESELSSFALDGSTAETHASFSQKNLLRLAALTGSHRTLSLFTPSIRDAVFRAWAGPSERGESGTQTPNVALSSLQRSYSTYASSSSAYSLSGSADSDASSTRPPLTSYHTWHGGAGLSRPHPRRTRKKRVVNLRRKPTDSDSDAVTDTTTPEPSIVPSSAPSVLLEEREEEPLTPPRSPNRVRFGKESGRIGAHLDIQTGTARSRPSSSHRQLDITSESSDLPSTAPPAYTPPSGPLPILSTSKAPLRHRPTNTTMLRSYSLDKLSTAFPSSSSTSAAHSRFPSDLSETGSSGGILEQAWMMKMAGEIARRVGEEKERRQASSKHAEWESRHGRRMMDDAPPAYVV